MRKVYGLVAILLLVTVALVGCGGGEPAAPAATPAEPYKVGVTGAITGPAAVTAVGKNEGFRIFFADLNDRGGINGHLVNVMIEDDAANPAKAAANMAKFVEAGVHIVYNNSMSSSYLPTMEGAKRGNFPVVFTTIAPTQTLPPTPDPLFYKAGYTFGPRSTVLILDVIVDAAQAQGVTPKIGFLAAEIPISALGVELLFKKAQEMGIKASMKVVPLATVDMSAVAESFMADDVNLTYFFGPGGIYILLVDSMVKAGWEGTAMDLGVIVPFEQGMKKYKGKSFYRNMIPYLPLGDNLPEHQAMSAAAKKYGSAYLDSTLIQGWYDGKLIAEVLRQGGWPVTTDKLVSVMQNLTFDRRPVMPPVQWTPTDHTGPTYWRQYAWEGENLQPVGPWYGSNAAGTERFTADSLADIR